MQVSVTFRRVDPTESLKDYAREKVDRVRKYVHNPFDAHVVLSTERYLHIADITLTLHNGIIIKGREGSQDMYSSLDLVMDKIERQVRKYKEKIHSYKTSAHEPQFASVPLTESVIEQSQPHEEEATEAQAPPRIIRTKNFYPKPMTVEEAVMQLHLTENEFLVFTHATTKDVNVIYRRKDGNLGLIETGRGSSPS